MNGHWETTNRRCHMCLLVSVLDSYCGKTHDAIRIILAICECTIQWHLIHSQCCVPISTAFPKLFHHPQQKLCPLGPWVPLLCP